jgi:hypothetical protein
LQAHAGQRGATRARERERERERFLLLSGPVGDGSMITKLSCTYSIRFLRQDQILRDHGTKTRGSAPVLAVIRWQGGDANDLARKAHYEGYAKLSLKK